MSHSSKNILIAALLGLLIILIFTLVIATRQSPEIIPSSGLTPSPQPSPTPSPSPQPLLYKDHLFGFAVQLPKSWAGYKVDQSTDNWPKTTAFSFAPNTTGSLPLTILNIYVFNKIDWQSVLKKPTYLTENSRYVFAYDYSPDCVQHDEFQCARATEVPSIIKTFTLLAPTPLSGCKNYSEESSGNAVNFYFLSDEKTELGGEVVGCEQYVVPVKSYTPKTKGVLKESLEAFFSEKNSCINYKGISLRNPAFYNSATVDRITVKNEVARIELVGQLNFGGVCAIPAIEAQIEKLALQFPNIKDVEIYINGKTYSKYGSLR